MTRGKKKVRIRIPKRTEASIEAAACELIQQHFPEVLVRKLNGMGNRNWPDRMFLFPGARVLLIEFKQPGEKPRPAQAWFFDQLRDMGFVVRVCDQVLQAVDVAYAFKNTTMSPHG